MRRLTFDAALDQLAGIDPWLASLGIPAKNDRWHNAVLTLRRAKSQREQMEKGEIFRAIPNYVPALFEVMEMSEVCRAFRNDSSSLLKEKLLRALGGPASPLEESARNSGARNTMFELFLAAAWRNSGAEIQLGEPDVALVLNEGSFLVECKRPFSAKSVRENIEDAAKQLRNALDEPNNRNSFGVIAISVSRVFSSGDAMCFAPEGKGKETINAALIDLIEKHKYDWRWDTSKFHDRIAAVMFHLSVPWDINGERLIYLSTLKFVGQAKCEQGFKILRNEASTIYAV